MYLYLGEETVINSKIIIGIFDLDNTTVSKITRDFLGESQKANIVKNINEELPKSFIVCNESNENSVYITQISPNTLKKRADKRKTK